MSASLEVQHNEHVHYWNEPPETLARLATLLKNDDGYAAALTKSTTKPERTDDEFERHRKFRALVRAYLETHLDKVRAPKHKQKLIDDLSRTDVAQPLVSAAREIMGVDAGNDVERVESDKRERLNQWIEGLLAENHYSPAFQYLMWGTMLRKRKQEERIETPLPPFHDSVIGAMEELVTAYDRAAADKKQEAIRHIVEHDNLFTFARGAGFGERLTRNVLAHLNPKNGSILKLHEELDALVTDVEYGEGEVIGQWITITSTGIAEEWPKEMVEQFGAKDLKKKGDGAKMLQLISQNVPWCLNRYATADSYLKRGKLLVYVTKSPKGWIPAFGIAFNGTGSDAKIYERRGADDSQEMNPRFAGIIAARPEIQADPYSKKRIDDALALAYAERVLTNKNGIMTAEKLQTALRTIYEIEGAISGFGRGGKPALLQELRKGRKEPLKDAEIIFGTVATSIEDLKERINKGLDVKAYIGPLATYDKKGKIIASLFPVLNNTGIKSIYTSFPEERKIRRTVELQPTSPKGIRENLRNANVSLVGDADSMVGNIPKEDLDASGSMELVTVQVRDLFSPGELKKFGTKLPTTDDIFDDARLERLGLAVCPATVASAILQKHGDTLPNGYWESIGMKRISDRGGDLRVFRVGRGGGSLGLDGGLWAGPGSEWDLDDRIVFRLRKE